jgi:hypothetical protein
MDNLDGTGENAVNFEFYHHIVSDRLFKNSKIKNRKTYNNYRDILSTER